MGPPVSSGASHGFGDVRTPECRHGHILLGCTHDECPDQRAYTDAMRGAHDAYLAQLDGNLAAVFAGAEMFD